MLRTGSYSLCYRLLAAPTDFLGRGRRQQTSPLGHGFCVKWSVQNPPNATEQERFRASPWKDGAGWGRGGFLTSLTNVLAARATPALPDKLRRQFQRSASLGVAGAGLGVSKQPASPRPLGAILLLAVALAVNLEDHKPPQLPPPASCRHHHHLLTHTRTCCVVWAATSGVWNLSCTCRGLPAPTRSQSGAGGGAQRGKELLIAEPPEAGRLSRFPAVI